MRETPSIRYQGNGASWDSRHERQKTLLMITFAQSKSSNDAPPWTLSRLLLLVHLCAHEAKARHSGQHREDP